MLIKQEAYIFTGNSRKKREIFAKTLHQNSLSAMRDKYSQGQHVQRAKRLDGLVNFVTNVVIIPITNAA